MFHIEPLSPKYFDFAVQLSNTMDWKMTPEDFTFMASLEPNGSFLLLENSKPVGVATCISYGKLGWIGNLIVDPQWQRKNAGTTLVKHAINYLQANGVETVGLYAYTHLKDFYKRLGFVADQDFILLNANKVGPIEFAGVHRITKENFHRIAQFDSQFFGSDRSRLLRSIVFEDGNVGYYASERGHVIGYTAATIYPSMTWVGPLICHPSKYDVGGKLIASALAKATYRSVYMVAPKADSVLLDMLASVGFKEKFTITRMFLGKFEAKNCIYLAESLERG